VRGKERDGREGDGLRTSLTAGPPMNGEEGDPRSLDGMDEVEGLPKIDIVSNLRSPTTSLLAYRGNKLKRL
jgi:hypothetical protein